MRLRDGKINKKEKKEEINDRKNGSENCAIADPQKGIMVRYGCLSHLSLSSLKPNLQQLQRITVLVAYSETLLACDIIMEE